MHKSQPCAPGNSLLSCLEEEQNHDDLNDTPVRPQREPCIITKDCPMQEQISHARVRRNQYTTSRTSSLLSITHYSQQNIYAYQESTTTTPSDPAPQLLNLIYQSSNSVPPSILVPSQRYSKPHKAIGGSRSNLQDRVHRTARSQSKLIRGQ